MDLFEAKSKTRSLVSSTWDGTLCKLDESSGSFELIHMGCIKFAVTAQSLLFSLSTILILVDTFCWFDRLFTRLSVWSSGHACVTIVGNRKMEFLVIMELILNNSIIKFTFYKLPEKRANSPTIWVFRQLWITRRSLSFQCWAHFFCNLRNIRQNLKHIIVRSGMGL